MLRSAPGREQTVRLVTLVRKRADLHSEGSQYTNVMSLVGQSAYVNAYFGLLTYET